ncbi:hypothetical protein VTJ49DRAFT_6864 [Mycothermus thermophilus]|uniref:Structural maintenance of chromosomes protein 5 n=1 Tax=Humicola insolens TaxID=85995 RepID=A0ABR3VQ18_HUMIN
MSDQGSSSEPDPFRNLRLRGGEASSAPGFQPGAIVRVKVRNFVTYEEAEFFLGPNLNMVIGPNGTGKSSLVCAICLGLGYSPINLGRATQFSEYVKHGKDEAEIEIELQRKPEDEENYVVGLCIRREDNNRRYTLNGQRIGHKELMKLMHSLRIQIDNLCQFLPQDKVAEFAALTPIELLDKTLHAAAPEEMIQWRAELKELFQQQKENQRNSEKTAEEIKRLKSRQANLQTDVDKLREKKVIQKELEELHKLRMVVRYDVARQKFREAKVRKTETARSLKQLERSVAPAFEAVNKKQDYASNVKLVVTDRKRRLQAAEEAADAAAERVEAANTTAQQVAMSMDQEKKNIVEKKQKISAARKTITHLEAQYRRTPPEFDAADWNRRIRDENHKLREKDAEAEKVNEELRQFDNKRREIADKFARLKTARDGLDSQEGQLLNHLRRIDADAVRGWEWLKENKDGFEKEVFGPPVLTCSVKDKRYSDHIQSMLQKNDFVCFTVQTKEDHKKLSDQFYRKMGLSVTIRSSFHPLNTYRPPLPREELANLGFEGYVTDYFDGPEPVLAMLCAERKLHASAVSLRDVSDEQFDDILRGERLNQFAAGRKLYRITRRREYGPGAVSTRVQTFHRGVFWTEQAVDAPERAEIERQMSEINAQGRALVDSRNEKAKQKREIDDEREKIQARIDELQEQKNQLQREYTKWQGLPLKIETEKKALEAAQTAHAEALARALEMEKQLDKAILDKARAALHHHKQLSAIREARWALLEAQLILMEAESDVGVLKAKNTEVTQQLEEARRELMVVEDELKRQREIAAEAQADAVRVLDEANPDEMRAKAAGKTVEDIDQAIQVQTAKLDLIQASNPTALEEYERYAERIKDAETQQERQNNTLAELDAHIEEIKSQWEPKLDELVGEINDAFSYNFEQISCAGEVAVHKDEDFDKWAIEIRVKFRENETLQRLDQHRQSGGERAVSTIFYLMALQSMAQAPFRVVDEINQGMDPRNERMVHERMVEVACREHTSQYFLITPKLLSGLRYDERMRVHTIVSGENVDERGTEKMDFRRFAGIQRRLTGRA